MAKLILLCILLLFVSISSAFVDPFSAVFVGASAATSAVFMLVEYVGLTTIRCQVGMVECCGSLYIRPNMTALKQDFSMNLYGQHLAERTVFKAVKSHYENDYPSKPLVMSFHGWTGGGKNFVARMIVRNIYIKAEKSSFVHIFNAEVDFKHQHLIPLYKDQLQQWIRGNVSRCSRCIFIFDEMDHMPEGLIDAVKPFLGSEPSIQGIDYRKSVFIFLSNTGGTAIVNKSLEVWKSGKPRSSLTLFDFQETLETCAYNQKSGLKLSSIIDKNMIDHFVPFLPLEREHVKLCIQDEIERIRPQLNIKKNSILVEQVMDELQWFPKECRLYSKSGCKKIAQKVALVLDD